MVTRQGGVYYFLSAARDKASHPCGVQDIAGGVICALSRQQQWSLPENSATSFENLPSR